MTHTSSAGWFLSPVGNAMPPRDPNDDDDDDEDEEDEQDERKSDEPRSSENPTKTSSAARREWPCPPRSSPALLARLSASANSPLSSHGPDEALGAIVSRRTCINAPARTAERFSAPLYGVRPTAQSSSCGEHNRLPRASSRHGAACAGRCVRGTIAEGVTTSIRSNPKPRIGDGSTASPWQSTTRRRMPD